MAYGDGDCSGGRLCWRGLCCLFSQDLGENMVNVTTADVRRCLQMCCWPQQWDWSPVSPGRSVSLSRLMLSVPLDPSPARSQHDGQVQLGAVGCPHEGCGPWIGREVAWELLYVAGSGPG